MDCSCCYCWLFWRFCRNESQTADEEDAPTVQPPYRHAATLPNMVDKLLSNWDLFLLGSLKRCLSEPNGDKSTSCEMKGHFHPWGRKHIVLVAHHSFFPLIPKDASQVRRLIRERTVTNASASFVGAKKGGCTSQSARKWHILVYVTENTWIHFGPQWIKNRSTSYSNLLNNTIIKFHVTYSPLRHQKNSKT